MWRRYLMELMFYAIRSKKAHGLFARPKFDVGCCVVSGFKSQCNLKSLAQIFGNGILWALWIIHSALTGREEYEQKLKVLILSIIYFPPLFFQRLAEPQLSVHLNNLCGCQNSEKLAKFKRRCSWYLTLLHGYIFPSKSFQAINILLKINKPVSRAAMPPQLVKKWVPTSKCPP